MFIKAILPLFALTSVAFGQGSILLDGHTDISLNYEPSTNSWTTQIVYGSSYENPESLAAFNEAALVLNDQPFGSGGARFTVPDSGFEFLGAAPGSPLWIAPQSNFGYTWPGFRSESPVGALASYTASDPRVSGQGAQPWIKIDLVDVNYFGLGTNPQVSLWQSDSINSSVVWAATSDGLDSSDAYYQLANGHSHLNWGFTEKGIFQLEVQANAYRGPGMTNLTQSDVEGVFFAVGTFAIWKATYYSGNHLLDDAVTGATSDSDFDGIPLLLEYAFNLSPVTPDVQTLTPAIGTSGLPVIRLNNDGRLQIEFVRRKQATSPEISYEAQFASGLEITDWQANSEEIVTSIDTEWERVLVTDTALDGEQRFARVVVTLEP